MQSDKTIAVNLKANLLLAKALIAVLIVIPQLTIGQPALPKANPEDVGMSSDRLARIDNFLNGAIDKKEIPGAVALVARNGKIVHLKAYGKANSDGDSLETNSIFRIASMTKAVTATALMLLWEEGKFNLDDPISKWIPEFRNPQILDSLSEDGSYSTTSAFREISIRDLVTHTSGVGYGEIDADPRFKKIFNDAGVTELFTTKNITIEEVIKKAAKLPIHHQPGEKYTYGIGLDILGYFIEIVSEMPMDEFFRTRIFDPLGMDDTYFYLPKNKADRLVEVQTKMGDKWVRFTDDFYDVDFPIKGAKTFFSGGAGLSSTAEDYAKFIQMYLNQGVFNGNRC